MRNFRFVELGLLQWKTRLLLAECIFSLNLSSTKPLCLFDILTLMIKENSLRNQYREVLIEVKK